MITAALLGINVSEHCGKFLTHELQSCLACRSRLFGPEMQLDFLRQLFLGSQQLRCVTRSNQFRMRGPDCHGDYRCHQDSTQERNPLQIAVCKVDDGHKQYNRYDGNNRR
ncbi:MAG: hypothetical protein NTW90_01835 [Nitrosospira sp.]|nr:hypothetical protein [Nitrosospira sp.]